MIEVLTYHGFTSDNRGLTCPDNLDEFAEEYLLDRLSSDKALEFEDHYLSCPECAATLQASAEFAAAMRRAAAARQKD
jgi:hypothetical protein